MKVKTDPTTTALVRLNTVDHFLRK